MAEPPGEVATSEPAPTSSDRLAVALVRGVHGLRGAVRVEVLTDRPEQRYAVGSVLHREGSAESLTVTWSSAVNDGPGWRLQFAEVHDRSAAEDLKGAYLEIDAGPDAVLPRGLSWLQPVVRHGVTPAVLAAATVLLAVLMVRSRRSGRMVADQAVDARLTVTEAR